MKFCLLFLTLAACFLTARLRAAEPPFELQGTDGKAHTPLVADGTKPIVLIFVSPFCSTTRPFMPEINAIAEDYAAKASVYLVHSDSEITVEVAFQHSDMSNVKATVLVDKDQRLAKLVKATVTPEAIVLSPASDILYRGRINDLYLGPTKRQRSASTKDLRDALDSILIGKSVASPQREAQGCKIGGLK